MKLLFSGRPAYGHIFPMMPLAEAARAAGHDVVWATGESFVPRLRSFGYEAHVAGISIQEAFEALGPEPPTADGRPDWDRGGKAFVEIMGGRTAHDLLPLIDRLRPDLVIYELTDIGAAVAASVSGLPAISHSVTRALPAAMRQMAAGARLDALWASHGVTSPPFDALDGDSYLDIYPASVQDPIAFEIPGRIPMRPVPWSEPGAARLTVKRAGSNSPLVYLTLGTMVESGDVVRTALDGLATLDADIVVALGGIDEASLGRLPGRVQVVPWIDQADLLRRADLAVHHGGSGTTLGAWANGLPQLILPQGADQFINADTIVSGGLGLALEPSMVTPDAVGKAANELIEDPAYRRAAAAIASEIAGMPHPTDVLQRLVKLAKPRPPSPGIVVVRPVESVDTMQGLPNYVGISAVTAGSSGLGMNIVELPPGVAAEPHYHDGFETAIYLMSGQVETRYGDGLARTAISNAGDFLYIPAGVPHQPRNLSATEPACALVARNTPAEQESVVPYVVSSSEIRS